ncbi:MAG: GNAT family N-acetyltransferase [Stackebrandtia sp.]
MDISTIDVRDDVQVRQLFDLRRAVHEADQPDNRPPCSVALTGSLRNPRPWEDAVVRVVRGDGRIVGCLILELPTVENLHFCHARLDVHPDFRRRGVGSALMEEALRLARERDRRTMSCSTIGSWEDGPKRPDAGRQFLEAMGFTLALTEVSRRADVTALDSEVERRLYDEALAKSQDYETIAWAGRTPEELYEATARLNSTFLAEAPLGELELEPERIDVARARAGDDHIVASGFFMCGVVARPKGSTEVVANTVIGVATEPGDFAGQWITIVSPPHRGHKLGLRVKLENHRQLRRERPEVRHVDTGNADVNAHMIAINELLGFEIVDSLHEYQRDV